MERAPGKQVQKARRNPSALYTEKNGDQRNMGDYWKIGKIIR